MKLTLIPALALVAVFSLPGGALAQASGGPDAKGNAPVKTVHTVNDGTPKRGANSFTEAQARQHIETSGFSSVSNLAKGEDGVWRGQAMRNGQTVDVAMDFKGNVSIPVGAPNDAEVMSTTTKTTTTAGQGSAAAAPKTHVHHHRRHRHAGRCMHPSPNGAACSGVDRNHNGISDREDRAIKAGAKP